MQVDNARLQETHEINLRQLHTQLEEHVATIQQLTTRLREKEERLREKDVRLREMEQLLAQLQQKDTEHEVKKADISRLQKSAELLGSLEVRYKVTCACGCQQ